MSAVYVRTWLIMTTPSANAPANTMPMAVSSLTRRSPLSAPMPSALSTPTASAPTKKLNFNR